ncbi:MAG TPA: lamin tail domain-containing protein [Pyrinomonadaceae bacterium]|nr:lamin tail domain-containing protein [Pyrinomonadaceae bacterium]
MVWHSASTQSPLRRITKTTEDVISINPSISGDGRIVAFESTEDIAGAGGSEAFRAIRANIAVDPATFLQMGVTRAPAPAISQDGSRIAFASKDNPLGTNNDANSEIFLYDGARLIQVTNTSPADISTRVTEGNFQPTISDDGRYIAFSSNRQFGGQSTDGNLEIYVYDAVAQSVSQLTNSAGAVGSSEPKISGNGSSVAYIYDSGTTPGARRLLLQNRNGLSPARVVSPEMDGLAFTYGRAISDDGLRIVWSARTAANSSQVFLFDGRNDDTTRQISTLGTRVTDVPLHPTISGDGSRIAFATRRTVSGAGSNSDGSVELYTFDIPSGTLGRVTNVNNPGATADVVSAMNDDGSVIAFSYPRLLSGPVSQEVFENNSEIYVSGTPPRPASGTLTILNRASFGHEPSSIKAVAPDSIAVALGGALSFTTQQAQHQSDGTFPTTLGGTRVTVNGQPAQMFFVSPNEVHFHVPATTALGAAEVVVTNSDGFQSRGSVTISRAAPGVFTNTGDGLGEGMILNADTLQPGPFDPTNGNLRLLIFSTGVRNGDPVSVTAGGRTLTLESIVSTSNMPGMDEVHVLVPADLRGVGKVDLVVRADGRDSNPVTVEFVGDARRDVLINEFLADPPGALPGDLIGDANRDGTRSAAQDEFVELVNTTTHDIDISGYHLFTRGTGADVLRHEFAAGTILRSCSAIVIFGGGTPSFNPEDSAFGGALVVKASSGGLSLVNSSGAITLQDQTATIVNLVAYGVSSGIDADNDQSVTRSPDITGNFTQHLSAGGGARAYSPGTQISGAPFDSCTAAVARVEVSPASTEIEVAGQQQFTARAFDAANNEIPGVIFSWQSSNTFAATIDQNGLATGVSPGLTEISATGRGLTSPPATLKVTPAAPVLTSVTIEPAVTTIGVGETQQFTAQAKDQTGQNIGGVTITFASNNTTVATVDAVSATSASGSATATVTGRANGLAEIRASATNGSITVTSSHASLTVEPGAGQLLISEFRTRGPSGAADEFVEIYNPTTSTLTIGTLKIRASNSSGTISDRVTITAGTTLGPGCHYLVTNSGYSDTVPANQTYGTGITDDGGIAITGSNGTRIIDAVGMGSGSALKEGNALTSLTGTADQSYERKPGGVFGNGVDTNDNAADFSLTAPSDPQSSSSGCLDTSSADLSIVKADSPDPVTVGSDITYTITLTNNGAAVAQNVTVKDDLPSSVVFVSCNATGGGVCGGSGNNRIVSFTSLASGASATLTFAATANAPVGSTITNTATITSTTPDTNSANNSATATTTVQAPVPPLSMADVVAAEGNSGTSTFTFTVSLAAPAPGTVTFDIVTQDNTATSASGDYVARSLVGQTIATGETTYTFDVTVNGDILVEPNETFFVNVTNISGATISDGQSQGTIQNDDAADLVISQVYGGGNNASALYRNDFVEIFNRGTTAVDFAVTPYSVQYAGVGSNFGSNKTNLSAGTIAPGRYFLVQESGGTTNGAPLPTPDAIGTIAMGNTSGKVALLVGTSALAALTCPGDDGSSPFNPVDATIADFVGYGNTVSTLGHCYEGSGPAPAPSNTNADLRKAGGCIDTNDNAPDFFVTAPFPRNSSSPLNNCVAGTPPDLTINDVAVSEGNSGTTTATFTLRLSAPAPANDITFDIATQDHTATANSDYLARTLTNQIIPAGQQTYSFTVNINGDTAIENDEMFLVNMSNVSGATLTDGQGVGTIQNDDLPALSINDAALAEGNGGTTTVSFTVSLSAPAPTGGVTFDIATQDDTATVADNDYVAHSLTGQTIPAGSSTYTFDVAVNGDLTIEANETFFVNLTNVSGATLNDAQGVGTIQNDDSPTLSINDVSQAETNSGTTTFTFAVTSSLPAPAGGITFDIATADGSAQDDIPPSEDNDYIARSLTAQTITAGNTSFIFEVTVKGDTSVETSETFFVNLTNVSNATVSDGQGQGTIQNDDTALLVISQVYGGGGNASATYTNDFIEIFNRGTTTIDFSVTPYSVQYAAAGSNFSTNKTDITSGVLLSGQYFLVQEGSGGVVGSALPTPDALGTINLAATAGKVALVSGTTPLTGTGCPLGSSIVDFLGYGSAANCFETAPIAVSGTNSNARSVIRTASCTDTNNNSADFSNPTTAPVARNTAATPTLCP